MINVIIDAVKDTVVTIPLLFITFLFIEFIEHKMGKNFDEKIKTSGKFGPIAGALLGIVPQCGFSVMGVAFYSQSFITLGTLISIFIATSDEALPILISTPGAENRILPFIGVKIIFAVFFGYAIDIIFKNVDLKINRFHEESSDGCCGDECIYSKFDKKEVIVHSIKRALKIALYIFIITAALNILLYIYPVETFTKIIGKNSVIQIIISSIIGLIPNCAVSVGLIEIYIKGIIGFPAVIAGLASNAGLAMLVLFKEVNKKRNAFFIMIILTACSILSGLILMFLHF